MEQNPGAIHEQMLPDRHRPSRLAKEGYPVGIAPKDMNVVVDPLHPQSLVLISTEERVGSGLEGGRTYFGGFHGQKYNLYARVTPIGVSFTCSP